MNLDITRQESEWKKRKDSFYKNQNEYNQSIDELIVNYQNGESIAIEQYCSLILQNSKYPFDFNKKIEILYSVENKVLGVEYSLPIPKDIPTLKEVKFIARNYENREYHFTENQMNKKYDAVVYKIVLRCLFELFSNDANDFIDAISFNGWVTAINKSTGKEETKCIVSIYVTKPVFNEINLESVDPKQCFKGLKGVGSSTLFDLAAVQPIMLLNKKDKRIVMSKVVNYNDSTNLAAMNWEDFEHLIREIFEKEFSSNGGEVKVTQASRDGGVDAIAFDPDPIRGGKIVIQAKRYTNTVGVSAVRDLYGTVMNEGATKGILVTTSDYGSDSYEFAKGKPLTLLNGGNLLYLLEKHGHKAKIDIEEARRIMKN